MDIQPDYPAFEQLGPVGQELQITDSSKSVAKQNLPLGVQQTVGRRTFFWLDRLYYH